MSDFALTSLAILKVNWDESGKDYVDCFIPFLVQCIRILPEDVISLPALQEEMDHKFRLALPVNALRMILSRACKQGYLRKEHGVFLRIREKCEDRSFEDRFISIQTTHDNILHELCVFAKNNHEQNWSDNDASAALHRFLHDNSLSLLFALTERNEYSGPRDKTSTDFIVGDFIEYAQRSKQDILDGILTLLHGNLLVNVLYLPDPARVQQRFRNTRIYLDTTIIIYAAGYAGSARAAPCSEVLALLRQYGADIFCFKRTRDEVHGILDACAARLRNGRFHDSYGPSMEYFIESGRTASDVELMAARLSQKLSSIGISIDDNPPYEKDYQVDESGFEAAIDAEIHYNSSRARQHDVDCISAVARLRKGRESQYIESCYALFVTTNTVLARTTRRFFQSESSPGSVALCMTEYAIGNLLWLKNPTAAPELPRKQLLAHAYASMQPSDHLWKKYLAETARLQEHGGISEDDYYLLRHSLAAKSALMDLTLGEESTFTEGTVQEVLIVAKERLRADLIEAVAQEQDRTRLAETRLQNIEERQNNSRTSICSLAAKIAAATCKVLLLICGVLIVFGILLTFPWEFPMPLSNWNQYLFSALLIVLLIISAGNLLIGVTVRSLLEWLERRIAAVLIRSFLSFAGLTKPEENKNNNEHK